MSEEKHTPGPWHADISRSYGFPSSLTPNIPINPVVMGSPVNRSLAKVPRLYPEAEANARLIAAAPDLLDALKALTHSLDVEDLVHDDQRSSFAAAIAAIAKSTGGAA